MQFVRTNCLAGWRLFEQTPKCIMQFVRTNCLAVWRLFEQNPKCICSNKLQNALCSLFEQTPKLIMQFVRTTSKIHYAVCSNKLQNSLCSSLSVSLQYLNILINKCCSFLSSVYYRAKIIQETTERLAYHKKNEYNSLKRQRHKAEYEEEQNAKENAKKKK